MEETRKKEDERGRYTAEAKEMTTQMSVPGGDDNDDEYTPEEIMQLVDRPCVESFSSPTMNVDEESFRVRFIDDPYAVPVVVQSSTGYITINVNEESCGPSFSDSNASARHGERLRERSFRLLPRFERRVVYWRGESE
ncbi:unnamed protein product [Brassica rapa]|uniref:Uncharacterized protein n=1 Tax=Brassica campestris TaxID=3711 RepID=A0A3P6CZA5_BRACM|nr:unnamed protein product [Brassica rapa]VDD17794.1 unnamed protein product [Brassica rapa]